MVRTTWEIAARCFNTSVAKWSAWIWALYPAAPTSRLANARNGAKFFVYHNVGIPASHIN
jgi:hypothetical protein